jgi:NAD(P)-dependent dehydrogenase (short-subunit alcohol dehydrogenase family)
MNPIRFDERVVIVTGAGGGLGRSHALALAARGAAVVVNDLGGDLKGQGSNASAAEQVVAEIVAAGGQALANHDNIATEAGASSLVGAAMQQFGRVDALINNAGIVRDKSLVKMDMADFEAVVRVHLTGSALCTRAVWPVFQARGYGRVVFTTSAAGLYGNFGQANYAAAKMALVGLMKTLKDEGARSGILVNAVSQWMQEASPDKVSAALVYLASDACQHSGQIVTAGGGYFAGVQVVEGAGVRAGAHEATAEFVAQNWAQIQDMSAARAFANATDALVTTFGPTSP